MNPNDTSSSNDKGNTNDINNNNDTNNSNGNSANALMRRMMIVIRL